MYGVEASQRDKTARGEMRDIRSRAVNQTHETNREKKQREGRGIRNRQLEENNRKKEETERIDLRSRGKM